MGIPTNYPGLTPEMVRLVKNKAYSLSTGHGHTQEDREDLEQEMALQLLSALPKYNPDKSQVQTFANRVVDYWATTQIEKQQASCRDYRQRGVSLDEPCVDSDGENTTLCEMIREDEAIGDAGALGCIEAVELKIIVEEVLETLSPQLRELCRSLMTYSVADLCKSNNWSRGKVEFDIKKIRKAFRNAGLGPVRKKVNQNPRVSIM